MALGMSVTLRNARGAAITAEAELTLSRKQNTTNTTSCYVAGGVLGKSYQITNKITTLDGKVDTRYVTIVIDNQSA